MTPRCSFYVRTQVTDEPTYRYDRVSIGGPAGDTRLHTDHPPAVGDLIHLWDPSTKSGGQFRVVERAWVHSSWGSADWPYGEPQSRVGPMLDLIVEPAVGPFVDEAPSNDEDDSPVVGAPSQEPNEGGDHA